MGGYIGATAVGLTTTAADVQGDITSTDTTPELILKNTSEEDTEGGREGKITFKGEQSGGEESTLAQIESAHDGTSDDQKGDLIFKTNDGSDGASPTEAMRIDSAQNIGIGDTAPDRRLHVNSGNTNECAKFESTDTEVTLEFTDTTGTSKIKSRADFRFETGSTPTERMRIDSSGNVGIGNSNPDQRLTIGDNTTATEIIQFKNTSNALVYFGDAADADVGYLNYNHGSNYFRIGVNAAERMRIDSSGNLLIGTTNGNPTGNHVPGMLVSASGQINIHRDAGNPMRVGRSDTGNVLELYRQGGLMGKIGVTGAGTFYGDSDVGLFFDGALDAVAPFNTNTPDFRDNAIDLGTSSARFDDVRATNGTIQTSDENEKEQIASLTSAEITAAKAISKLFKTYKWRDKVAAKGDAARTHIGVVAQQIQTAMSDAGLDASKYAFWCSDTWTNDDGNEQTRMGIRYPELLAFIGAATEQRLTSIEARLDALEG